MPRGPKPPRLAALLFSLLTVSGLLGLLGGVRLLYEGWQTAPGLDLLLTGAPAGVGEPTGWLLLLTYGLGSVVALGGLLVGQRWGWILAGVGSGSHVGWLVAQASDVGLQPYHTYYGGLAVLVALVVLTPPVQKWVFARQGLTETS